VLDHIQRRGFPKQPAGENPLPLILAGPVRGALVDQKLDKGTLFRRQFPGSGFLAGPQTDYRAADPNRLAGAKLQIARQAVALVEKAERGHAFGHRCADLLGHRCDEITVSCSNLGFFGGLAGRMFINIVVTEPATAGQQQRGRQYREQI
jgi:hypothetical protein